MFSGGSLEKKNSLGFKRVKPAAGEIVGPNQQDRDSWHGRAHHTQISDSGALPSNLKAQSGAELQITLWLLFHTKHKNCVHVRAHTTCLLLSE